MADSGLRIVLQDLFSAGGGGLGNFDWRPFHDGVEVHWLYSGDENSACAALLRYLPGARVPQHRHVGFEHIIVLSGRQADAYGEYPAGTVLINAPGSGHAVFSETGCVVLAIWEKPVDIRMQSGA